MVRLGLKTKISITVSLLVALLVGGVTSWIISLFEHHLKETIAEQQFVLLRERARDVDETIQRLQKVMLAKAATLGRLGITGADRLQQELNEAGALNSMFEQVLFISPAGVVIAETPTGQHRGADFSAKEYFRSTMATGTPCISKSYFTLPPLHHPMLTFTAPVFDKNHRLTGVLAGGVDLLSANFMGHNGFLEIGKTGYAYIYDSNRVIIVHPDRSRILQAGEPLGANRVFDKALQGFEGTEENINAGGMHALTTVKRLKTLNWFFGANYPMADAYAPIKEAITHAIVAGVAGVVLSVAIVWWVMKLLTAPLLLLTKHMRKISESQGVPNLLKIESADEIEELADTFNDMLLTITGKQEELRKFSFAVEQSASMVVITDTSGEIEYVNQRLREVTGYASEEIIGRPWLGIFLPDAGRRLPVFTAWVKSGSLPSHHEQSFLTGSGESRLISWNNNVVYAPNGSIAGIASIGEDVTERREVEQKLRDLSIHDMLTGLYNRAFFAEELERVSRGRNFPLALITADLDGLKELNDTLGHAEGDKLLQAVARIFTAAFRGDDVVARSGGDEFLILLPGSDEAAAAEGIKRIRKFEAENNRDRARPAVSVSLGAACAWSADEIPGALKLSDERMYQDKLARKGRGTRRSVVAEPAASAKRAVGSGDAGVSV